MCSVGETCNGSIYSLSVATATSHGPYLAREAQRQVEVDRLLAGEAVEDSPAARKSLAILVEGRSDFPAFRAAVEDVVASAEHDGIRLTTVLDDDYPFNLRVIDNLPPFLFYRGRLDLTDAFSMAVVGTREASQEGLRRARKISALLAKHGVTVLSGMARGIDTAAHTACLEAGRRTIAVLGSGTRRTYPPENEVLAERIVATGAVVSQFWPDAAPTKSTFPRRNVVMSGMGQGTVVIEASSRIRRWVGGAAAWRRAAPRHRARGVLVCRAAP